MKVTYYPGCSLEGTARDYSESIHSVCEALGVTLQEVPDWNCCGATAAHSVNHKASIELAARNLNQAALVANPEVLVPCPLCFNRLKTAEWSLKGEEAGRYDMRLADAVPQIVDLANYFGSDAVLERMAGRVVKPLEGLKAVAYYGCMSVRPPHITGAVNPENPQRIDRILKTLGATPLPWPYKTDCCGASLMISRPDMGTRLVGKLYDMAQRVGAQAIVVSCQMCQLNLDMYQARIEAEMGRTFGLPVIYFTELIGLALGLPGVKTWLSRHITDPAPVLREAGFLD